MYDYYFYETTENDLAKVNLIYYVNPPASLKKKKNYIIKNKNQYDFKEKDGYYKELFFNKKTNEIEVRYKAIPLEKETDIESRILDIEKMLSEII